MGATFFRNSKSLALKRKQIESIALAARICVAFATFGLTTYFFQQTILAWLASNVASHRLEREANYVMQPKVSRIVADTRDYQNASLEPIFGPMSVPAPAATPAPKKSIETNLRLVGTFVSPDSAGVAIVEDTKTQMQDAFEVSETVFDVGKLVSVSNSQITVQRADRLEIIEIDDLLAGSSPGPANISTDGTEEKIAVNEVELDQALENLPLLLTQARAVPYFEQGKSVGLRLFAIKSGSLFEKVGLRNGDILKTINGQNLGDFSKAMTLFEQLKRERSLKLQLVRNRQPVSFVYQIR